jgi:methylenetetrahydrofolate dehydrogenase (NADP+)/methenyltetrahydrofolate cyclohydrolase/formyltetrahydrofolate synthetase
VTPGAVLAPEYTSENLELLSAGICNLEHHIKNMKKFGLNPVVAINCFSPDTAPEIAMIRERALAAGALDAVECRHWAKVRPWAGFRNVQRCLVLALAVPA